MSASDKSLLAQAGFSLKTAADQVLHLTAENQKLASQLAYYVRRDEATKVASDQVALGMHPDITDFNTRVQGLMSLPEPQFQQIKSSTDYLAATTGAKVASDQPVGTLHDPRGSGAATPATGDGSGGGGGRSPAMDRLTERVAALNQHNPYGY